MHPLRYQLDACVTSIYILVTLQYIYIYIAGFKGDHFRTFDGLCRNSCSAPLRVRCNHCARSLLQVLPVSRVYFVFELFVYVPVSFHESRVSFIVMRAIVRFISFACSAYHVVRTNFKDLWRCLNADVPCTLCPYTDLEL
jgi:hypothetical protein